MNFDLPDFNIYPPEEPVDYREPCKVCCECKRLIVRFPHDLVICDDCLENMTASELVDAGVGDLEDQGGVDHDTICFT